MKRKQVYTLLVILCAVGFYLFETYYQPPAVKEAQEEGEVPKETTNSFFLPSSTTGQVIHHNYFSLSYSEPHEQAEWVAYELKKKHLSNNNFKRPYFEVDQAVRTKAAHWRNYKNSGYDRGHLCPAGDRSFSREAFEETFITSNISPQMHDFNSGIWNRLEQKVRYWAQRYDGVYVVTGGILEDRLHSIGEEEVSIPKYFYKVLLDNSGGRTKMIAFLLPHAASDRPLYEFVVSVDSIEKRTGIDFFPQLEDGKEARLEAKSDYKEWSFQ
ncbi:DNA/RNA non-specific endonuclease [Sungkyunkwania multivorans]|uniref:Endonuclease n=1 Tax=Sungkyunkwania multivorans TaxID=1173618 RepID=A0ABW3D1J9_9FLAO